MEKKKAYHSAAYHRYFEGYEELQKCMPDGRVVIERFYTGMYYRQNIPDSRRRLNRGIFALCLLAAAELFLYTASRPLPCSNLWYVNIPSVWSLVTLILTAMYTVLNLIAPREMEIHSYRDAHERLIAVSRLCAAGGDRGRRGAFAVGQRRAGSGNPPVCRPIRGLRHSDFPDFSYREKHLLHRAGIPVSASGKGIPDPL